MIIARVVFGVKGHLRARWVEWVLTAMILNFGLTLLRPEDTFANSHSFDAMAHYANEKAWGICLSGIGIARFVALFLNGTFAKFKVLSPYVRSTGAGLSSVAWFLISTGIYASGNVTPGAGTYALLMVAEIIVCLIVAQEAGSAEKAYRDGRTGA